MRSLCFKEGVTPIYFLGEWTNSAKYVSLDEQKIRKIDPIIYSPEMGRISTVDIHEYSEIKDGCL